MNRRQLLTAPLALMAPLVPTAVLTATVPTAPVPVGPAPAKPVRSGKVLIFQNGTFASGRLSEGERAAWRQQLQMARQDPDYTIVTSHRVQCYDTALRGRIVSVPGATAVELREACHEVDVRRVQGRA